jgi:hypothetical protein
VSATVLDEPFLEFAGRGRHVDPRFGIRSYGAADRGSDDAPSDIHVGLVGDAAAVESARTWLERCADGLPAKDENEYPNLWQAFPGFNRESGSGADLIFSERLQRSVRGRDLAKLKEQEADAAVASAVDLYLAEIEGVAQTASPDAIVCVIPLELLKIDDPDVNEDDEAEVGNPQSLSGRFHDELKARAMRYRVPLQLMRPSTYDPKLSRGTVKRPGMPAQVQDEATRAWNFLTALYYKAGGTPWRLVRDDADLDSCFVGISFYWEDDGRSVATSVAQVFNERGDGVVVRGGPATRSTEDKQLHIGEDDAHALLRGALKAFRDEHKHLPARVVVHKTSPFDAAETGGMMSAVDEADIEFGELVWVSQGSGVRLYRDGYQPPLRGTLLELEPSHAVLYTRGAVEYYGTYPGQYVPRPIALRPHRSERSLTELAAEVMALSKMNWNSTQFDGLLPVTIRTARDVGDIIRRLPPDAPVEPRYAFYM